jgi:hypothetical protein
MKIFVFGFVVAFSAPLEQFGDFLLAGVAQNPDFELTFVMVIVPMVLNILAFWVTDCFLKFSKKDVSNEEDQYKQNFEFQSPFIENMEVYDE